MLVRPGVVHSSQSSQHTGYLRMQFRERLEELVRRGAGHPKLAALVEALRRHFGGDADCGADDGPHEGTGEGVGGGGGDANDMGRAIVFTNLRESVATIVDTLAMHAPLIKPRCVASLRKLCLLCPRPVVSAVHTHQATVAAHEAYSFVVLRLLPLTSASLYVAPLDTAVQDPIATELHVCSCDRTGMHEIS